MTPAQHQLLRTAVFKVLRLNEQQYRTILRNVANVESSKELNNQTFENVMAVLEDMGFVYFSKGANHFRNKVAMRGSGAGERQVDYINRLIANSPYPLKGLVRKFSDNRTDDVEQLKPAEARNLIEMLKRFRSRPAAEGQPLASPASQPGLFGEVPPPAPKVSKPRDPAMAVAATTAMDRPITDDEVPF
jgi:hypothetical protein